MTGLVADVGVRVGPLDLRVTIEAGAGETVAVLGPNGAGKTTLLRALAGLVLLDAGHVSLGGKAIDDAPPEARAVGVVFQDQLLFPHLTALDNVAFGLRCRRVRRGQARAAAASWLARVGLEARAGARPHQLSGGEAQRVALARALVTEPQLLLLDEPLSALDATTRAATRRDLRRHLDEFEGVALVVTHDPVEAATLGDRVVVVEHGRVVQSGTFADIAARPRSPYVADLAGVNLFAGMASGGAVQLDGGGGRLRVASDAHGPVLAVVHPRAVTVHRSEPEGSARNRFRGQVVALDHESGRARATIQGELRIVAEVTEQAVAELALAVGEAAWVTVKATEVDVYPA